jgi:BirA family biotin operon repressor/biotin-[acetyl-CoA-carboxylase] ligase
MKTLEIKTPFNAPVFYEEAVTSTMDVSRKLAFEGNLHGTVITADFQGEGRGRIRDRTWQMEKGQGLPFTVLLRYPGIEEIPSVVTLRTGLAVSLAVEDFAPALKGRVKVKWPNDIMIDGKKAAGILSEADGGNVHIGIGINASQKEFPPALREKAVSIAIACGRDIAAEDRYNLLEKILERLFTELEYCKDDWKSRLEQRLYKKGEPVIFIEGAAGSEKKITGILEGIGENGELLIVPDGEKVSRSYITGELKLK